MKPSLFIPLLLFVACKGNSGRENPLADLDKSSEAVMEEFLCLDSIDAFGVNDFAVTDSYEEKTSSRGSRHAAGCRRCNRIFGLQQNECA